MHDGMDGSGDRLRMQLPCATRCRTMGVLARHALICWWTRMRLYRWESRVSRAIVQIVTIEPWPPVLGRKRIMVDRVQWGTIFMESHGLRGNHYWFSQQGQGGAIMDPNNKRLPGSRPTVKVESYDLAGRPGTRERDKELSDRLHAMAGSLIERGLLVHPDVIEGQKNKTRALAQARDDAERAE